MPSTSSTSASRHARRHAAFALLLALLVVGAAPAGAMAEVLPPDRDPFYAAPAGLADLAPGTPIRTRDVQVRGSSSGDLYRGIQVLYRTTDAHDGPIATVATVMLPNRPPATGSPNLVSYQSAYDGLAPKCRPSFTMLHGRPARTGDAGGVETDLQQGWAVVTADFEGPSDAWMAGLIAGHATLDGIRAAQALPQAGLAGSKVGLQGYSGGGEATAWANELATEYAPELQIVGAVQGGVPADPQLLYRSLSGSLFSGVALAAMQGISRSEPQINVRRYLNPFGLAAWKSVRRACLPEFAARLPFVPLSLGATVPDILKVPEIQAAALKNTLGSRPPSVPTWMWHARHDELVAYQGARRVATEYCAMGATLRFDTYPVGEHVSAAVQSTAQQISYLRDRFNGLPAPNTC